LITLERLAREFGGQHRVLRGLAAGRWQDRPLVLLLVLALVLILLDRLRLRLLGLTVACGGINVRWRGDGGRASDAPSLTEQHHRLPTVSRKLLQGPVSGVGKVSDLALSLYARARFALTTKTRVRVIVSIMGFH
jgi:hypothetical protein